MKVNVNRSPAGARGLRSFEPKTQDLRGYPTGVGTTIEQQSRFMPGCQGPLGTRSDRRCGGTTTAGWKNPHVEMPPQ